MDELIEHRKSTLRLIQDLAMRDVPRWGRPKPWSDEVLEVVARAFVEGDLLAHRLAVAEHKSTVRRVA